MPIQRAYINALTQELSLGQDYYKRFEKYLASICPFLPAEDFQIM